MWVMNRKPCVNFYHMDWAANGNVLAMTMQEVGIYWTMLVRQMVDGYVDLSRLHIHFKVATPEDALGMIPDFIRSEFKPLPDEIKNRLVEDGKFTPERAQGLVYNPALKEVMDAGSYKSDINRANRVRTPELPPDEPQAPSMVGGPDESPRMNFDAILVDYPRRKDKKGWDYGIRMMSDIISTDEEFQRLHAAVRAYKRERAGEDPKFTKRLDTFMKTWVDYVPSNFKYSAPPPKAATPAAQEPAKPPEPALTYEQQMERAGEAIRASLQKVQPAEAETLGIKFVAHETNDPETPDDISEMFGQQPVEA